MAENKFIKHLKGEQAIGSLVEIKNQNTPASFGNMPQGTSDSNVKYSDVRGDVTIVANGTTAWKLNDSALTLAPIVNGDGTDYAGKYEVSGAGLWVNSTYTFPSTGDPNHPVAMIFNPNTKWVLKLCGDNLIVDNGETLELNVIITIGSSNIISKQFTIREQANQFCKELVIDFDESNSALIKASGLSTMQLQVLCGTADASANIYNGMSTLTVLQRKVDASVVSGTFANVEEVMRGGLLPNDYFSNAAYIAQITDGATAYAIFQRDGDDVALCGWAQPIPDQTNNAGKFLTTDGSLMSWEEITITFADIAGDPYDNTNLANALNAKVDDVRVNNVSVVQNRVANITIEKPDWTETDSTKLNYILHKPTNVSDFTNDANYQNASEVGASITTAISTHNTANDSHSNIITPIKADITDIQALIPSAASTSNQLADKDFVNSTVATQTANFIGTFANVSELRAYSGTITNNDYAFVINQVVTDNGNDWATFAALDAYDKNLLTDYDYAWVIDGTKFDLYRFDIVEQEWSLKADNIDKEDVSLNRAFCRYKATVSDSTVTWNYEYTLNNSSFTAAQWAAINSGITQDLMDEYLSPTSASVNAYVNRISALEGNKVDKTNVANRIYGTNASGEQTTWQAGDNIELGTDGKINVVGVQQQMFEMPEATADLLGSIVQYLGDTDEDYTHGVMYQCVPVYGSFTVTSVGINNVTLDEEVFKESFLYDASIPSYTFECTRGGLRQTWRLPNGQSWMGGLMDFGIGFRGRPSVGSTITLTRSVVGYAWEAYAGVSAGNDKIKIVGEKISGINVVGQYNQMTMPRANVELAGKIVQFNGESDLLSMYRDGHFYRCEENRSMRNYTLEGDPMKYSTLVVDNWFALEDFMSNRDNPVTFLWQGVGRGWVEEDSMSMLGTDDLTQYGITYTLESGQTLEAGDKITINFTMSYFWRHITVQDGVEVSNYLPEASSEYVDRVLLLNNVLNGSLPEPESLGVDGKLYTCIEKYNEMTGDLEYEWKPLPYQFNLLQYTELPSDITKVYTGQCIQYVGTSQLWNKYAEDVYLEKGHIYRATIVDEDDPDFAAVRYVDAHPYQMVVMPDPIAAYEGVVTQYVGTNGTFTNGHFYKCVPTGQMTGPSDKYKKPEDATWSVSIDPTVLATHTTDPDQAQVFEFRSQAEGADWVLKVSDTTWRTVDIEDYGITVTGTVPYGSALKVKYVEPQPEYEWQEITVQQGGGLVDDVQVHGQSVVSDRVADLSVVEQVPTMATASLDLVGRVVQYTGNTTSGLVHGYFYEAITTLQHRTTTNYGIRIYDQTLFANFLKQDVESEGKNVSYFTVNRDSQSNMIKIRCYSTDGPFSTVHSYTDATFPTTGLTADETVGGAIATFSTGFDWTQTDVQPSGASGDIDCGTM